jgi:hypothetical protein
LEQGRAASPLPSFLNVNLQEQAEEDGGGEEGRDVKQVQGSVSG